MQIKHVFIHPLLCDPARTMSAMDPLKSASGLLAAGRRMQTGHMRVISENIANANSTAKTPGGDPYGRKIAVFSPILPDSDENPVGRVARDTADYRSIYDPRNPAADPKGIVKLPNVDMTVESSKLQEMIRSYELNLNASSSIDKVTQATLNLLR